MTSPRTTQGGRPPFRRGGRRRRQCFCKESTVDYKDVSSIRRFITDRGRIEAGKKSGNCAKCQRTLTTAIKRARHLALLPYAPDHLRVTGAVATSNKIADAEEETKESDDKATEATTEAKTEASESTTDSTETTDATEDAPVAEAEETAEASEESEPEAEVVAEEAPEESESEAEEAPEAAEESTEADDSTDEDDK
jgi:small subunit ribosomal protein S18